MGAGPAVVTGAAVVAGASVAGGAAVVVVFRRRRPLRMPLT